MLCTGKHRLLSPKRRLVRNIPETFKGLDYPNKLPFVTKGDACWYVSFLILQAQQWVINTGYSCVSDNTGAFLYADLFPNP